MLRSIQAEYKGGQFLFTDEVKIPENSHVFISFIEKANDDFFLEASETSLDKIWNNDEDDIYEQLLKK